MDCTESDQKRQYLGEGTIQRRYQCQAKADADHDKYRPRYASASGPRSKISYFPVRIERYCEQEARNKRHQDSIHDVLRYRSALGPGNAGNGTANHAVHVRIGYERLIRFHR
ncbi:hypothetical protein [Noviherbaspirillum aerium]|uniref:hypothetical protein n=1 Tax=Noviherbaspirillum aerium TaxID=2588497 RepID=UPI00124CD9EF|nr:hypothetical protein [Noviherbaspirillum aerium]